MKKLEIRTPEERQKLINQITEFRTKEGLTTEKACEKAGVNLHTFYNWTRGKKTGKRKYRKRKPKVETALVPMEVTGQTIRDGFRQSAGSNSRPTVSQAAEMLAVMNARSMQYLLQGE